MMAKDKVISLLQHLHFKISLEKSVLILTHNIEFLGLIVHPIRVILLFINKEIMKTKPVMLGIVQCTSGIDFRDREIDRPAIINSISIPPNHIVRLLFAAKANAGLPRKLLISTN